jgi:tripartite ATP-independent transporter DctP family solute receptor
MTPKGASLSDFQEPGRLIMLWRCVMADRAKSLVWLLGATVVAIGLLGACAGEAGVKVLKLAHGLDVTHPVHRAMVRMSNLVAERSDGGMRIDIYPSEQLGSERECVELIQIGSIAMTKVSAAVAESFIPSFKVFSLPYLFTGRQHLFAVMDGPIGRELLLQGVDSRLRGLCYFDSGSRSFYTRKRPVRSPSDLEGLKIRTQESATAIRMVRALGGSATPISWGELYTALQQGVVDGAENNPPSFFLSRHYEVCRYYSLDEHTAVPDVLLIGTATWNRLPPEEQEILQRAALDAAEHQKVIWKEASDEALAAVAEAGIEILHPDKEPFAEAVAPLIEEYRSEAKVYPWIERIRALGREMESAPKNDAARADQ